MAELSDYPEDECIIGAVHLYYSVKLTSRAREDVDELSFPSQTYDSNFLGNAFSWR